MQSHISMGKSLLIWPLSVGPHGLGGAIGGSRMEQLQSVEDHKDFQGKMPGQCEDISA